MSTETKTRASGVLAATCLSTLVVNANASAVSILLPAISEDTGMSVDTLQWAVTGYSRRPANSRNHRAPAPQPSWGRSGSIINRGDLSGRWPAEPRRVPLHACFPRIQPGQRYARPGRDLG